jgi:flagellar assembly factor FliW
MTIHTERFGEVTVDENRIIHFVEPILGFERSNRYVILDHAEDSPFKWLQSADEPNLAFVVTNPKFFGMDYEFELPDDQAGQLHLEAAEDALVVTIVNIPQENPGKMTTNLLGPVIINQKLRKAMQVVLHDSSFSTKTRLIPDELLQQQATEASPATAKTSTAEKGD